MRPIVSFRCLLLSAFTVLSLSTSVAGTANAGFDVMVRLIPSDANGICISSALSQQTNALVKVTCTGGQFVSIEPRPGSPFLGTHGGAWRFQFPKNAAIPAFLMGDGELQSNTGTGTITAMRVLELRDRGETLELLVSF